MNDKSKLKLIRKIMKTSLNLNYKYCKRENKKTILDILPPACSILSKFMKLYLSKSRLSEKEFFEFLKRKKKLFLMYKAKAGERI